MTKTKSMQRTRALYASICFLSYLAPFGAPADVIKVKGPHIRPSIVTTNATELCGVAEDSDGTRSYGVTAQLVGTNVVVVEQAAIASQALNTQSVSTLSVPTNSLPRTFNLRLQPFPNGFDGCGAMQSEVTILRVVGRDREKELRQDFGKVGDNYADMEKNIIAAGGERTYYPCEPVGYPPEPVVDAKGNTNWVSRPAVDPYENIRMFGWGDGRMITITVDGNKVSAIEVRPAFETND